MKKEHNKTAAMQLTRLFVSLFIGILIAVNLAFFFVSSAYVYHHAQERTEEIIETVQENLNTRYDQTAMLNAYLAKQDDDAITLTTPQGRTYYSENSHEIFKEISHKRHFNNMVLTDDHIYYVSQKKHNNYLIRVAFNVDELFELIIWLWIIMAGLNLLAMLVGIYAIKRLAKKWSRPIQTMDQEIQKIQNSDQQQTQITVPDQPLELKNLACSFNHLLAFQHKALVREQQFVSDASHELKTPLAAIRGHVNLIKRRGKQNPEIIDNSLKYIDSESKRMEILVNEFLTLGRIEHNSVEKNEPTDLVKIISETVTEISSIYPQKITTSLPQELFYPIQATDFQNIVHNLVENAAKYSPAPSSIHIDLVQKQNNIVFSVTDQGRGIAPENREKVFERFYREDDSHASTISGSGLGLAIVKAEIEKYHGQISIAANQPRGCIFTVTLPIKQK